MFESTKLGYPLVRLMYTVYCIEINDKSLSNKTKEKEKYIFLSKKIKDMAGA